MESAEYHQALALLQWQIELGATEAICDAPVNRYEVPAALEKPKAAAPGAAPPVHVSAEADPAAEAERAAAGAASLDALRAAMAAFEHCDLRRGARNLVFADGTPGARVMIIGEAPSKDEDRDGKPFAGRAGQLLDRMLAAIDMGRAHATAPVYVTTILPWRPPQDRDPKADEITMMKPFLTRHIELAKPDMLVIMGNWSAQTLLGKRGITRLRGQWAQAQGVPVLPMFHPTALLRNPELKREAWADLLQLKDRLARG